MTAELETHDDQVPHLNAFSALSEKDIDLMLLEEFWCNRAFAQWFLSTILSLRNDDLALSDVAEVEATHSVGSVMGETDLHVKMKARLNGVVRSVLLLIENKITASFTDEQPARYQKRLPEECSRAKADLGFCVLVAPQNYVKNCDASAFNAVISYEALQGFFRESVGHSSEIQARFRYRKVMLEHALLQHRRSGGQSIIYCEGNDTFFKQCYALILSEFAGQLTPTPDKARGLASSSINFNFPGQKDLKQLCRDQSSELPLRWEMAKGMVFLRFHHWPSYLDGLEEGFKQILPSQYAIVRPSGSKSLDVALVGLPTISSLQGVEQQRQQIHHCLLALIDLQAWIESHTDELKVLLNKINGVPEVE